MLNITRRDFLGTVAAGAAAGHICPSVAFGKKSKDLRKKIPMLHATDLFRPYSDPDDHWDLACVYALACSGDIDLKGVLIDFPPAKGDPDVMAVAQMNFIIGMAVPVVVGSPVAMKSRGDIQSNVRPSDHNGVRTVFDVLRTSAQPVVINITGSCRDIAIAGKLEPALFAEKCAAIYLNAGTGSPDRKKAAQLEYNVSLESVAYAAIFDLPCPVYWMPCFEEIKPSGEWKVMEYGTNYKFRQDEILPHLSDKMQNYFAYMLGRIKTPNWLRYLTGEKDQQLLAKHIRNYRNMWCTGGFLHAAGKTVSRSGEIVPLDEAGDSAVFRFEAIKVSCDDNGLTQWTMDKNAKNRYIFHVCDINNYQSAMAKAMRLLLMRFP